MINKYKSPGGDLGVKNISNEAYREDIEFHGEDV
jgi:hypothetical protein